MQATNAKTAKKESGNLLRSASDARKITVNEIALLRSSIEQKGGTLKQNIDEQKARIDALRAMFDDGEVVQFWLFFILIISRSVNGTCKSSATVCWTVGEGGRWGFKSMRFVIPLENILLLKYEILSPFLS